jgi:hypothetical protein
MLFGNDVIDIKFINNDVDDYRENNIKIIKKEQLKIKLIIFLFHFS